jgi:L-threonylcarbamoyladenylate synthase
MRVLAANTEGIAEAAAAIRAGEVVAYPTETIYGLAVNPFSPEAIERLFAAKGRDAAKAILLIVADIEQLESVADIPPEAQRCMDLFWPGPLSLVLPRKYTLPDMLTAGGNTIGVRCPASEIARALCRQVGFAITSTSANLSGDPPARCVAEVNIPGVSLVLDGGPLFDLPPSTVYDPVERRILREGAIPGQCLNRE